MVLQIMGDRRLQAMSTQLSYMPQLRLETGLGTGVWLIWGAAGKGRKGNGKPVCTVCSPAGLPSSNYKYLLFVFLKSAHMEPSNRLNDLSVAT